MKRAIKMLIIILTTIIIAVLIMRITINIKISRIENPMHWLDFSIKIMPHRYSRLKNLQIEDCDVLPNLLID